MIYKILPIGTFSISFLGCFIYGKYNKSFCKYTTWNYIENISFRLDMKILINTAKVTHPVEMERIDLNPGKTEKGPLPEQCSILKLCIHPLWMRVFLKYRIMYCLIGIMMILLMKEKSAEPGISHIIRMIYPIPLSLIPL